MNEDARPGDRVLPAYLTDVLASGNAPLVMEGGNCGATGPAIVADNATLAASSGATLAGEATITANGNATATLRGVNGTGRHTAIYTARRSSGTTSGATIRGALGGTRRVVR